MRSLKELANEVLMVQNASNMLGVSRSFGIAMSDLRTHCSDSDSVAQHPITRLWISKLESLNGLPMMDQTIFDQAYDEVNKLAAS